MAPSVLALALQEMQLMQWTVRDLAEMFRVTENTVTRWVNSEGLVASKVSGELRFNPANVVAWTCCHETPILEQFVQALDGPKPSAGPLGEALERGGILPRVMATDKRALVAEIVDGLALPDGFDRRALAEVLFARPSLGGQLFADGVLAPQPRYPLIVPGSQSSATLFFLQTPLPLVEPQGRMVDTLFVIMSPTVPAHLSLLAQLKSALLDLEFRDLVKRRQSHSHIFRAVHRLRYLSSTGIYDPSPRSD